MGTFRLVTDLNPINGDVAYRPHDDDQFKLLRFVDRAELDLLVAAFIAGVGIPASIVARNGELVAGEPLTCPACNPTDPRLAHVTRRPTGEEAGVIRCSHGLAVATTPIASRTGDLLGLVRVGPFRGHDEPASSIRAELLAANCPADIVHAVLERVPYRMPGQAMAAAQLLARTINAVVREAAVATENVALVAKQRQANRELAILYSVAQALSPAMDLEAILTRLVEAVADAFGVEVVTVGLIEGDHLVTKASRGLLTLDAATSRLKVGEGFAGRVALSGEPMTCVDMQADPREYLTAINAREGLHAFVGVPLKLHGATIGVLSLYRRVPHAFPESELRLLTHISDQTSVAIERARLYEQERTTVGQLRALHAEVEAKRQALERVTQTHDRLTHMVLEDRGLVAIVETVASVLGAPVAVEDRFLHLLAYAGGPHTGDADRAWSSMRSHLDHDAARRVLNEVHKRRRPVRMEAIPEIGIERPRLIAPILAGGDLLGYLSVDEYLSLADLDLRALDLATTVVALEMLKQRTGAEVERRLRGELLDVLIGGAVSDAEELRRHAAYLGYDLDAHHALLVFAPDDAQSCGGTWPAGTGGVRDRVAEALSTILTRRNRGYMISARGTEIIVLAPLASASTAAARELATSLLHDIRRLFPKLDLSVGIGRICRDVDDYPIAFTEAQRALALVHSLGGRRRVVAIDELGVFRLLADLPRPREALSFADQALRAIDEHDRTQGSNLLGTLEAFLAQNGVAQRAADALGIHVNTLTYRLQRLRDLTGLDLNDSDTRFELHLAIKIRQATRVVIGG